MFDKRMENKEQPLEQKLETMQNAGASYPFPNHDMLI
jgi:hypothetical protein